MARRLGARNPFEGVYKTQGGFSGPPPTQSSVATPNPPPAGVSGQPAGGMSVGQRDEGGMTPAPAPSNATVTGLDPDLVANFVSFVSNVAPSPTAGLGPIAGPLSNIAGRLGVNTGISAIPSDMTTAAPVTAESGTAIPQGSPVTYGGKAEGPLGVVANSLGLPTGSLFANVPSAVRPNDPIDPTATPQGLPGEVAGVGQQGLSVAVPSNAPATGPTGEASGGNPSGGAGGMSVGAGGDGSGISSGDDGADAGVGEGDGSAPGVGVSGAGPAAGAAAGGVGAGTSSGVGTAGGVSGEGIGQGEGEGGIGPSASDGPSTGMSVDVGVVGDGGTGGAAGGPGSLLCNFALDSGRCGDDKSTQKNRRDLNAIAERAFREKPELKESFKHYQEVSKKIIAKMKALPAEQEEAAFADLHSDLVEPVSKAARRGDATTVGRALRRAVVKLAAEYDVEVPEAYLAASEKYIGPRSEDDKSYKSPEGKLLKPEPKRLAGMLEPDDEPPMKPEPAAKKSAGLGGMSVGLG